MRNTLKNLGIQICIFFSIGVGYAAWNTTVSTGEPVTANGWNEIISKLVGIDSDITSLNSDISNFSFSGSNVAIAGSIESSSDGFIFPDNSTQDRAVYFTICNYSWPTNATGWRSHTWVASDCSHGLPESGSNSIGSGRNGNGTVGQISCSITQGGHYNHPSVSGATSSYVTCLYLK